MFTKQHYQRIAQLLNAWLKSLPSVPALADRILIDQFCDMFQQDNENFKREAFLDAVWKGVL